MVLHQGERRPALQDTRQDRLCRSAPVPEYGITDLSAQDEYNYVSLGKDNFQLGNTRTRVGVNEHLVKAGLNYRF